MRHWPPGAHPDHPHAGGENWMCSATGILCIGPSPRGWGELRRAPLSSSHFRTIPTRVGRTVGLVRRPLRTPDHPHAGGENLFPFCQLVVASGPSPRGWGERQAAHERIPPGRTIPTRVGRTLDYQGVTSAFRQLWGALRSATGGANLMQNARSGMESNPRSGRASGEEGIRVSWKISVRRRSGSGSVPHRQFCINSTSPLALRGAGFRL